MVQTVIYPHEKNFQGRLAILTIREHLCGFYESLTRCREAGVEVDTRTGHHVCLGCERITVDSGLRVCDICGKQYINKAEYQNPRYETNCPNCIKEYGLDNVL